MDLSILEYTLETRWLMDAKRAVEQSMDLRSPTPPTENRLEF
jgi:hypothetical protein